VLQFFIFSTILLVLSRLCNFYWFLFAYWLYFAVFKLRLVQLIVIKLKDVIRLFRDIKHGNYFKLMYGIYGVVGEYGQGKTVDMAREYVFLHRRTFFHNPDRYIFISNFHLGDSEHFSTLADVLEWYKVALSQDKGLVIFWDEIQNEYPENDRSFPQAFRTLLTQNRKNKGVRLIWSTQDYTRVNKNIRLMTTKVVQMRCLFKRYMIRRTYSRASYEDFYSCVDIAKKTKLKSLHTEIYIQSDFLRSLFDSFGMLDVAKKNLHLE
jgi:hypothetical protein